MPADLENEQLQDGKVFYVAMGHICLATNLLSDKYSPRRLDKEARIMKLMTKEIEQKLSRYPFGSQEQKDLDAEVIVKYFYPYGRGTWLIIEGEKFENGDWQLFGYCHIYEWEWGYIWLSQLEAIHAPKCFGCGGIERDLHIGNHPQIKDFI